VWLIGYSERYSSFPRNQIAAPMSTAPYFVPAIDPIRQNARICRVGSKIAFLDNAAPAIVRVALESLIG
jgi:hypothetical protein